jgi:hypothetical protein
MCLLSRRHLLLEKPVLSGAEIRRAHSGRQCDGLTRGCLKILFGWSDSRMGSILEYVGPGWYLIWLVFECATGIITCYF